MNDQVLERHFPLDEGGHPPRGLPTQTSPGYRVDRALLANAGQIDSESPGRHLGASGQPQSLYPAAAKAGAYLRYRHGDTREGLH